MLRHFLINPRKPNLVIEHLIELIEAAREINTDQLSDESSHRYGFRHNNVKISQILYGSFSSEPSATTPAPRVLAQDPSRANLGKEISQENASGLRSRPSRRKLLTIRLSRIHQPTAIRFDPLVRMVSYASSVDRKDTVQERVTYCPLPLWEHLYLHMLAFPDNSRELRSRAI